MKSVIMKDWFKLPVSTEIIEIDTWNDAVLITNHGAISSHHAEKIEIAINNHDRLVQEAGRHKGNLNELINLVADLSLSEYNYDLDVLIHKIQGGE